MPLALYLAWRIAGVDETYRQTVKRLAFAGRYGHAGEWMFHVGVDFLEDFTNALAEIVEEENRPRK